MKFSILVCTLGNTELLNRCIKSVKNQTYKSLELIIIHQGDISLKDYLNKKYFSIKIGYFLVKWKGLSMARNYGIKKWLGEYIIFLDADGVLDRKFLEYLNSLIINIKVDGITGIVLDNKTKQPIGRTVKKINHKGKTISIVENFLTLHSSSAPRTLRAFKTLR